LFLGIYFFSGLSRVGTSFDSRWSVYIAMSLWRHGDTNLDEYKDVMQRTNWYAAECVAPDGHATLLKADTCNGHWYNTYPPGGPILTAPLTLAAVGVMHLLHPIVKNFRYDDPNAMGFFEDDFDKGHAVIEMEVASALLAATGVIVFHIARMYLPVNRAVWLTLLFATGTSAYSVAGRGLWQHTPSILLLSIVIYLLLGARERPALAAWAGLPVALSYTVRPTDSLFVIIFTVYVAVKHTRYLLWYLLAAAPIAAIFLGYNFSIYHGMLSPYYRSDLGGFRPENWPRWGYDLFSVLFAPSRGLFIYTPIFLFSVWSMVRRKWSSPVAPWLAVLALAHWLVIGAYISNWWAGHSYGPRFFTDVTPIFVLFLIPFLGRWESHGRVFRATFLLGVCLSVAIHLRGGWSIPVYRWNADPVNVDEHPSRNWDWSDPQFLRRDWRVEHR